MSRKAKHKIIGKLFPRPGMEKKYFWYNNPQGALTKNARLFFNLAFFLSY